MNKLTFGELNIGDMFIGFPLDGDNNGHGGYKGGHVLYRKIQSESFPFNDPEYLKENNGPDPKPIISFKGMRVSDGADSTFPDSMHVIKIV
jgi:hypothetical protein